MDPITGAVTSLINALQAASADLPPGAQPPAQLSALLELAGREVAMTLLGQAAEGGVNLALPSGQVVTAQGRLPYPDGTRLLVQVQAAGADGGVRLQIRQAAPTAQPAILAPLVRGEAATLLASLGQPDPPQGLADLAGLFRLLGAGSPPGQAQVQAAVDDLPVPAQAALGTLLAMPAGASGAELASALDAWLAGGSDAGPAQGRAALQDPSQGLLQRFQALLDRHPDLDQGTALRGWMRQLVTGAAAADPGAARANDAPTPAQALASLLAGQAAPAAESPETWETWLRSSVKALSDPAAAPQSAPFHAAQAREGTAYYEIPLPWAPQQPLQLWVESDRDARGARRDPDGEVQRVLVGLSFTRLGETRLGLARDRAGLRVRVWTERPDLLEAGQERMAADLRDLGQPVDLRILPLDPGPDGTIPSLRSLVGGAGLEALG
jgi:hypothetical protein